MDADPGRPDMRVDVSSEVLSVPGAISSAMNAQRGPFRDVARQPGAGAHGCPILLGSQVESAAVALAVARHLA